MSNTRQRVDNQRCAWCDLVMVDAWVCANCALAFSMGRADDERSVTATKVGRELQRLRDRGAQHEQLVDLQTVIDADVIPVESTELIARGSARNAPRHYTEGVSDSDQNRSKRLRNARIAANDPRITPDELRKSAGFAWISDNDNAKFFVEKLGKRQLIISAARRRSTVAAWWRAFACGWEDIGWAVLDAATSPVRVP